jgi:hypothetical protein
VIPPPADQIDRFTQRAARARGDHMPMSTSVASARGVPLVGGGPGVIAGTRPGDSPWLAARDDRFLRRQARKIAARRALESGS